MIAQLQCFPPIGLNGGVVAGTLTPDNRVAVGTPAYGNNISSVNGAYQGPGPAGIGWYTKSGSYNARLNLVPASPPLPNRKFNVSNVTIPICVEVEVQEAANSTVHYTPLLPRQLLARFRFYKDAELLGQIENTYTLVTPIIYPLGGGLFNDGYGLYATDQLSFDGGFDYHSGNNFYLEADIDDLSTTFVSAIHVEVGVSSFTDGYIFANGAYPFANAVKPASMVYSIERS